jgi:hypothetical protein
MVLIHLESGYLRFKLSSSSSIERPIESSGEGGGLSIEKKVPVTPVTGKA